MAEDYVPYIHEQEAPYGRVSFDGVPAAWNAEVTEADFVRMLEAVPGAYPAFVDGVTLDAWEFGTADEVAEYIRDHPRATAGNVCNLSGRLCGFI